MNLVCRAIFWLQVLFTYSCLAIGAVLTLTLALTGGFEAQGFLALFGFMGWLVKAGLQSFYNAPTTAIPLFLAGALFLVSLFFFAQTDNEKQQVRRAALLFPISVMLFTTGAFGLVLSGLASQGAGQ